MKNIKRFKELMENVSPGFTFKENAVYDGQSYTHFGIVPSFSSIYGDKEEDIRELKVSEVQSEDEKDGADYWGWYDYTNKKFSMIYPKRFLLNMCFPSGIKATEEAGRGKAYRLKIINVK